MIFAKKKDVCSEFVILIFMFAAKSIFANMLGRCFVINSIKILMFPKT